jgi:hypothetical protein
MTVFIERLLVWGIFSRGIAVIYMISFFSLCYWKQVVALAGERGISPIAAKLAAIQRDIPSPLTRYCRFPTLLWFSASDSMLQLLPCVGILFAFATVLGGTFTPLTFSAMWIIYLSLDLPVGLKFPWDSLLLEVGFLAQLLPSTHSILLTKWSDLNRLNFSATHLPPAGVAWLYRLLLVRLMVGFGRVKFEGHKSRDNCYTQGFLISQPMPTVLGWLGSHLPFALHQVAIAGMFFIEIVLPWFIFFNGTVRFAAAAGIASLMIGIQLTGNFGYFNMLTIVLCFAAMDTTSTVTLWDEWWQEDAPIQSSIARVMVPFLFSLAVLGSLFQSWCNESWVHWPVVIHLHRFSPLLGNLASYCRFFSPFRIVAAYGVFPPASTPAMRFVTILEGSSVPKEDTIDSDQDENQWQEYGWRFMTSGKGDAASSAPTFIAPHHPRIDHSIFYTAFGINGANMTMSATTADPYGFNPDSSLCHRIGLRLLQGNCDVLRGAFFSQDPFCGSHGKGRPPRQIRASLYVYIPTSISTWWKSGCKNWWIRKKVGEHMSPIDLQDWEVAHEDRACAPARPEMFCVDHLPSWYMKADTTDNENTSTKMEQEKEMNMKMFWIKFVGGFLEAERLKWGSSKVQRNASSALSGDAALVETAKDVRQRFTPVELDKLKFMHSCFRTRLVKLFELFYFQGKTGHAVRRKLLHSAVQNASFSVLELLSNHIIAQGERIYEKAIRDPQTALLTWGTEKLTIDSGLFLPAVLYPTMFIFHARKWSIFEKIGFPSEEKKKNYSPHHHPGDQSDETDVEVDPPVPPEFYVWIPPWINQPYVQKALGVYRDQSLPYVIPPKVGELWHVDITKEA